MNEQAYLRLRMEIPASSVQPIKLRPRPPQLSRLLQQIHLLHLALVDDHDRSIWLEGNNALPQQIPVGRPSTNLITPLHLRLLLLLLLSLIVSGRLHLVWSYSLDLLPLVRRRELNLLCWGFAGRRISWSRRGFLLGGRSRPRLAQVGLARTRQLTPTHIISIDNKIISVRNSPRRIVASRRGGLWSFLVAHLRQLSNPGLLGGSWWCWRRRDLLLLLICVAFVLVGRRSG